MSFSIPGYITRLVVKIAAKKTIQPIIKKETGKKEGKIHVYRENEKKGNLILFIHGFTGDPTETFENVPELLMTDNKVLGYDIFSVGYSSSMIPDISKGIWSSDPDIDTLSAYLQTLLKTRFKAYSRICVVAHSMGGLITQHTLLNSNFSDLNRIKEVLFFGTPSNGLTIANLPIARKLKSQIKDMGSDSAFITKLRADWTARFKGNYPFLFKVVAGNSDDFISRTSSLEPFDKQYQNAIEGNHSTLVKADNDQDTECQCYRLILDSLFPGILSERYGEVDQYTLNVLRAKKSALIDRLDMDIQSLNERGLRDLILAYDTLGRDEDAIETLGKYTFKNSNTDFMGILGGRYKRKYLYGGYKDTDANSAIKLYSQGYTIAKNAYEQHRKTKDKEQLYYHAINLAFFSLVSKNDKDAMREYAQIALEHCDPSDRGIWNVATLAEANLYLGNTERQEYYYNLVLKVTQDKIRERHSIYLNAKHALEVLNS